MKIASVLAATAALAFVAAAQAQETTTAPAVAAPVPASTCGEFPAPPPTPEGNLGRRAREAASGRYEAWRVTAEANLTCRAAEYRALQAQVNARATEYETVRTTAQTAGAAWQAAIGGPTPSSEQE